MITIYGDINEIQQGFNEIIRELNIRTKQQDVRINVKKSEKQVFVKCDGNEAVIEYNKPINFFRALGQLLSNMAESNDFVIEENEVFNKMGCMPDNSHIKFNLEGYKAWFRNMAVLGLDTYVMGISVAYKLEDYPYFGYMTGCYSSEQIKEIVAYAELFGIEVIPCVQLLSHLDQFLKWAAVKELSDTANTLLVQSEKTYEFIEACVKTLAESFKSDSIHLGMDEAYDLGKGRYSSIHGTTGNQDELFFEHLAKVIKFVKKYNKKPMLWSDMLFARLKSGASYSSESEACELVNSLDKEDLSVVYWDYYTPTEKQYVDMLIKHKENFEDVWFAGGIWTWISNSVEYDRTVFVTNTSLNACKKAGVKKAFATMWKGSATNYFQGVLGLAYFAEHKYHNDICEEKIEKDFELLFNVPASAFRSLTDLEYPDCYPRPDYMVRDQVHGAASFVLLYEDLMMGLFDKDYEGKRFGDYYKKLADTYKDYSEKYSDWNFIFDFHTAIAEALSIKSDMGRDILNAYKTNNLEFLKICAEEKLPRVIELVENVRASHYKQWHKYYQAFGWQLFDIRYGGIIERCKSTIARLNSYLNKEINSLEELEVERLPYVHSWSHNNTTMNVLWNYNEIAYPETRI